MQCNMMSILFSGDSGGECRAHGNLGSAFFSKGSYKEALTSHRYQLVLAMKFKDSEAAASALTSLGEHSLTMKFIASHKLLFFFFAKSIT